MNKKRLIVSVLAGLMAVVMILGLVISVLPVRANAASSAEIQKKIDELQEQADDIQARQDELTAQMDDNTSDIEDLIARKGQIDEEIQIINEKVQNNNDLIQSYTELIAEKQTELDQAIADRDELNEKYKERLQAMEESNEVSYWSIIFRASSFLDLLDQINMLEEIAQRDQEMLAELDALAQEISDAQLELETEKSNQEAAKAELEEAILELDEKRAESDELLQELVSRADELAAAYEELAAEEKALSDMIAAQEQAYNEQKAKEEAANRPSSGSDDDNGYTYDPGQAGSGFAWPSDCTYITSAYGWRDSPFGNGTSTWHTGIDIGAAYGTPIYASKSGTVTTAGMSSTGYGNYVVINHGDGSSTLYGHMSYYIVSSGQTVSQGQVIGYVGSTGNSTGPHLHFNIYINGSTVNPLAYL